MAEQGAEFAFASQALKFGVIDDDGAGNGFAGFRVDDGFGGGFGFAGDGFGELQAGGIGGWIEQLEPCLGDGFEHGCFEGKGGVRHARVRGFSGAIADFRDGPGMIDQDRDDGCDEAGGD